MYSEPTDFHVALYSVALRNVFMRSKHSEESLGSFWLLLCETRDSFISSFDIYINFISFPFLISLGSEFKHCIG